VGVSLDREVYAAEAATDEWVSLKGYPGLPGDIYPLYRETQINSLFSEMNLCTFVVTA
jgi:hypothetical protein